MMREYLEQFKIAIIFLSILTILLGLIYPLTITLIAQFIFPWQANGSLLVTNGKLVGSVLIGQNFNDQRYFWGRPSATERFPYDAENSSGSNIAVSSPAFLETVKARVETLKQSDPHQTQLIPIDLVTASASGLDPEISLDAALYQIPRVAKANNIPERDLRVLVGHIHRRKSLGVLGERRVNVLKLNLALERHRLKQGHP